MFSETDIKQFKVRGISVEKVTEQINSFRKGFPYVKLFKAARLQNGIKVLDISDRETPRIIGSHNNGGEAYGIHIVDDYLLVADLQQGVEILDISNPRTPTIAASWTALPRVSKECCQMSLKERLSTSAAMGRSSERMRRMRPRSSGTCGGSSPRHSRKITSFVCLNPLCSRRGASQSLESRIAACVAPAATAWTEASGHNCPHNWEGV